MFINVITDKKSAEAITAFSADDCQKRFIIFSVHASSLLTLFLYENINNVIVQKSRYCFRPAVVIIVLSFPVCPAIPYKDCIPF